MSELGPHQIQGRMETLQNELAECEFDLENLPARIERLKEQLAELQTKLDWWTKPKPAI